MISVALPAIGVVSILELAANSGNFRMSLASNPHLVAQLLKKKNNNNNNNNNYNNNNHHHHHHHHLQKKNCKKVCFFFHLCLRTSSLSLLLAINVQDHVDDCHTYMIFCSLVLLSFVLVLVPDVKYRVSAWMRESMAVCSILSGAQTGVNVASG